MKRFHANLATSLLILVSNIGLALDFDKDLTQQAVHDDRWIFALNHSFGPDEWTSIVVETDEGGQVRNIEMQKVEAALFAS